MSRWIYSLLLVAVIAYLGYRKIDLTAKVLGVVLVLEILVVVVVDLAVLAQGGAEGINANGFTPTAVFPSGSGFSISAMFCAMSFIGFEATAVFRDEARDPDRTVPRATYLAICFVGAIYALSTWIVSLAWRDENLVATSALGAPFLLGAAESYAGKALSDIIQVLVATSLFACALSIHNILARYDFVLGRSSVLPSALGKVHATHSSPYTASLVTTAVTLVLLGISLALGLDPVAQILTWASGVSALGFFVLLGLTCLSTLVFFARTGADGRLWQTRVWPSAGFLSLLALTYVTCDNFPELVAKGPVFAYALAGAVPLFALAGIARALYLRARSPERYAGVLALTQSR
ncbi:APC family permease [Streptomyces sp. NPDC004610]|uniref:APC family permease n=1 Tax=unclassified Streptomyces TaxID=2593676 RepID=UPI0033B5C875